MEGRMAIEPFEVNGYWWLPGKAETPVAGRLTVSVDDGIELALVGTFKTFDEDIKVQEDGGTVTKSTETNLDDEYQFVHGFDGSESYTLIDCFRLSAINIITPMYAREVVRANSVLKGVHLEGDGPIDAEGFTIYVDYLAHWMSSGGFEEDLDGKRGEGLTKTLRITEKPVETFTLANGMNANISHSIGWDGDSIENRILLQDFRFSARSGSLVKLQDLLDIASDFQDLVSIGTGRVAEYRRVLLRRADVRHLSAETDLGEKVLEFFAPWTVRDDAKAKRLWPHEMYFSYGDLGGVLGVEAWLNTVAEYRSLLSKVMGTRYSRTMYPSDRLLNRAATLEAFDKAETGYSGSNFKTRITRCGLLAGVEFEGLVGSDVCEWAKAVKFERDDIAHHLGRHIESASPDLLFLAESLYWAFILCMLRKMNAPQAVFTRIFKNQNMEFLATKIKAAVVNIAALADAEDGNS
jgi:hypothetical protein